MANEPKGGRATDTKKPQGRTMQGLREASSKPSDKGSASRPAGSK